MLTPSDIKPNYIWDNYVTSYVVNFIDSFENNKSEEEFSEDEGGVIYLRVESGNLRIFSPTTKNEDCFLLVDRLKKNDFIKTMTIEYCSPSLIARLGMSLEYSKNMAYSASVDGNKPQHGPTLPIAVCKAIVDYINIERDDAE